MKKILIFFPDKIIEEEFYNDRSIIFFNDQGWSVRVAKKRIVIKLQKTSFDFKHIDFNNLISTLRFWGPLWARMNGKGDQSELLYRKVALLILNVASDIKKFKITKAIFMTGVTHHIDSLVFDYACTFTNVNKIFLYREVIAGRLIPILQTAEFPTKKLFNKQISKHNFRNLIDQFKINKSGNNYPISNYVYSRSKNFLYGFLRVLYIDLKFIARNSVKFSLIHLPSKFSYRPKIFSFIYQTYPFQRTLQIIQLKKALDYYESKSIDFEGVNEIKKNFNEPTFLIAANFQPEATSFPEGWNFSNHIDIVIYLRKLGVEGAIFYKEHPETFSYIIAGEYTAAGTFRSKEYYKQLEDLGCVFLKNDIDLSVDVKSNDWYIPITISGSIALERSLFGFPTIVAGRPWFEDIPGIISLTKITSLKRFNFSFLKKNKKMEMGAYKFLLDNLNNKTLFNNAGIGDSIKSQKNKDIQEYIENFKQLISKI